MKNPKVFIPIILGVLFGGIGAAVFLANQQNNKQAPSTVSAPTSSAVELATWSDQAGFQFQYPKDLSVDRHDEDTVNYAHIEFTHKDHPGKLIVWAKDTNAQDVTAWVKTEKRFSGASVLDTTLGNLPAKKILLTSPEKMLIVGTVSDEIVFTIEATLDDSDYWSGVHNTIYSSFAFTSPGQTEPVKESGGEGAVDEEETLE